MVKTTEARCPDVADLLDNSSQVHTCDCFLPEIAFKEALVDRFLTRVSGQQEVGEEDDGGHLWTDHGVRNRLVVMHEYGKLGVGIGEINLLIFDEVEVLHQLQVRLFGVLLF